MLGTVNGHFGKAKEFHIFELAGSSPEFIEVHNVVPLSVGDKNHDFDEARFGAVLAKISDCRRVYIAKIGDKRTKELQRHDITPVLFPNLSRSSYLFLRSSLRLFLFF